MAATAGGDPVTSIRPLEGPGRWLRLLPLAAIAALGVWLALAAPPDHPAAVATAGATLVAVVVAASVLPWRRWPAAWQALPAMGFLPTAALLEYGAGEAAEFAFLTGLAVIWVGLYHTRRLVIVTLVLVGLTIFGPPLLLPELATDQSWGTVLLLYSLSLVGGIIAQRFVARTRASEAEARTATSEARAAERRAHADRDLLNAYLDSAACLVIVEDRAGRVTLFNRFCEEITGYRAAAVVGQPLRVTGRAPEGARQAFDAVVAGQGRVEYEGDWRIRDGTRRRINWSTIGLVDGYGEVTHVISTGLDITDLRATERLFSNVLMSASEQIIMAADTRGVFTVFNSGAERYLGYPAAEVVGKLSVMQVSVPEEVAQMAAEYGRDSVQEMFAEPPAGDIAFTHEYTLVRKDGSRFPSMMTVTTMREAGELVGFVSVARDITAERQAAAAMAAALEREREAAEQLRQLDQVKNDFVATVSHDLRTPLTSIIGNTELLLDGDAGELAAVQRRLLLAVDRNARRLDTLVGDLLLLSRIESGTLRMNPRPVAVGQVIDGALEALAAQRVADVQVGVETPAEPILVQGDPGQLERVATNLISNALKFTAPGGQVTIAVTADLDQIELTVSDTGIGIPAEELPRVFDRFFRSSRSQTKDRPGTGLGLTIAKSIVEIHNGTIEARSNPSGGTTFAITLPRLTDPADQTEREPA